MWNWDSRLCPSNASPCPSVWMWKGIGSLWQRQAACQWSPGRGREGWKDEGTETPKEMKRRSKGGEDGTGVESR